MGRRNGIGEERDGVDSELFQVQGAGMEGNSGKFRWERS